MITQESDVVCAEVNHAPHRPGLEQRRMAGEQHVAFTYGLPLGQGFR